MALKIPQFHELMDKARSILESAIGTKVYQTEKLDCLTMLETLGLDQKTENKRIIDHPASSVHFNLAVIFLIFISSFTVGIELDMNLGSAVEDRFAFFAIDFFFTSLFFGEMLIRQNQLGWEYFLDSWNCFDFGLLVVNCADLVLSIQKPDENGAKVAVALRIVRLMRVARHAKGLAPFNGMYLVVQGLIESLKTMFWTGALLFMTTYVFAVVLLTVADSNAFWDKMDNPTIFIGSLQISMITIAQVFTLDSWASEVARPFMQQAESRTVAVVLVCAIVIGNFGILNLIIALMVERMSVMKKDIEDSNGRILDKMEENILISINEEFALRKFDMSHCMDLEEFESLLAEPRIAFKLRLMGFRLEEAESFFRLLDADGSGFISAEEFLHGLHRYRGPAKGADVCALISFAQRHNAKARANVRVIRTLCNRADEIRERLQSVGRSLHLEIKSRSEDKKRADALWQQAEARANVIDNLALDQRVEFPTIREQYEY